MTDTYVIPIPVADIFADHTYQRDVDRSRARRIAREWEPRLVGIIDVSDRGEDVSPRYAVVDGQHRWAAAGLRDPNMFLVVNVHTELTVAEEAELFDRLNRERKKVNTFEHYKARLASGEEIVTQIERVLTKHGLRVYPAPEASCIGCVSTLEKVAGIDDILLDETLQLIIDIWGKRRDAFDAPIIHGLALILHHLRDRVDLHRLVDTLLDMIPRQLKTQAVSLRDIQSGTLPILTAHVIMALYNKRPGPKITVTNATFITPKEKAGGFVNRYREARDVGLSDWEIAQRMNITMCSLVRQLERHKLPVRPETASMAAEERNRREAVA